MLGAPLQKIGMNYSFKNRVGSLRLVLGLAGLAFSIFLWGLAYKLSLYAPVQTSFHRIPRAKLLSDNERPTVNAATLNRETSGLPASGIALTLTSGLLLCGFFSAVRTDQNVRFLVSMTRQCRPWACHAHFSAILFRPPPVLC